MGRVIHPGCPQWYAGCLFSASCSTCIALQIQRLVHVVSPVVLLVSPAAKSAEDIWPVWYTLLLDQVSLLRTAVLLLYVLMLMV